MEGCHLSCLWTGLDGWWSGVCCTASSSLEPSTGTSTGARQSHTSARMQPARSSWSVTSAGLLQRTSSWHQRLWNASAVMLGCRPLSQWLSTPARSLMFEPTSSQSRRIWILAAEMTLAAMCAGCVGCSGRDLAASHSCMMTSKRSRYHKLSSPAAGCQGPRLSSASRRSACSGGAGCWVTAVHVAANQCQTAWETGQLSMTWLRVGRHTCIGRLPSGAGRR